MERQKPFILIFVEDAGGANYIESLPGHFKQNGFISNILAMGQANDRLCRLGREFDSLGDETPREILKKYDPDLLLIGCPLDKESYSLKLIQEAKALSIDTFSFADSSKFLEQRFQATSSDPLKYLPDCVLCMDQWILEKYRSLGVPSFQLFLTGHPHFDRLFELKDRLLREMRGGIRGKCFPKIRPQDKIILFVGEKNFSFSPEAYQYSEEYSFDGGKQYEERHLIVLEEFIRAIEKIKPRPYLALSLHPETDVKDFEPLSKDFNQIGCNDRPLYEALLAADLVVGMTSSVLAEAFVLERPVLSILPRLVEKEWLSLIRDGFIPVVNKRESIQSSIESMLGVPYPYDAINWEDVLPYFASNKLVALVMGAARSHFIRRREKEILEV